MPKWEGQQGQNDLTEKKRMKYLWGTVNERSSTANNPMICNRVLEMKIKKKKKKLRRTESMDFEMGNEILLRRR